MPRPFKNCTTSSSSPDILSSPGRMSSPGRTPSPERKGKESPPNYEADFPPMPPLLVNSPSNSPPQNLPSQIHESIAKILPAQPQSSKKPLATTTITTTTTTSSSDETNGKGEKANMTMETICKANDTDNEEDNNVTWTLSLASIESNDNDDKDNCKK